MTAILRPTTFTPLPQGSADANSLTHPVITVPHSHLRPGGLSKRNDQTDLIGLALSIYQNTEYHPDGSVRLSGVQMPLIARRNPAAPADIAVGDRRWHAVDLLISGFTYEIDGHSSRFQVPADYPMPVQLRELTDSEMLCVAATDSEHSSPLTELDQADLCVALHLAGFNYDQIARRLSVSFATVERRILLGNHLGREGRELLRSGQITMKGARLLCSASGELRQTLIQAARSGMNTRDLEGLMERGGLQVRYALFDVEASGLAVQRLLFAEQGPETFSDGPAALARQLQAVRALAQAHEQATGEWTEISAAESDPVMLPEAYQDAEGQPGAGRLYLYSAATGQVVEHRNVTRRAAPSKPARTKADLLPRAAGKAPNRLSGVKPWVTERADELRRCALADALMSHPKAGLVNAVLQLAQLGGNISVSGMTSAQRRSSEAVRAYATRVAQIRAEVFVNHSPGLLQVRREVSLAEAFQMMLTWPVDELVHLLTFFTCGSAFEGHSEYQGAVADATGANVLMADRYEMTQHELESMTRNGLEDLITSMPEETRPIIIPGESNKPHLRGLIASRLGALRAQRWVPPYARL